MCVCVCCSSVSLTHLTAGASHPDAVLFRHFDGCVGTLARVLGEAQVVVGAHVDHVPHDLARVPGGEREREEEGKQKMSNTQKCNLLMCVS